MASLDAATGGVECLEATPTSLLLTWHPIQGSVKYELQMRACACEGEGASENEWQSLGSSGFTSPMPPKLKKGLRPGVKYEFRVRGRDTVDWYAWAQPKVHATLTGDEQMLEPPEVIASDSTSLTVQWEGEESAAGYELQMRDATAPQWKTIATDFPNTVVRKKNLSHSHVYTFRVRPSKMVDLDDDTEWAFSLSSAEGKLAAVAPNFNTIFGPNITFKDPSGATFGIDKLAGAVVAIYFSAHWCPPCRQFTPMLAKLYEEARAAGRKFEVVFVSGDRDPGSFTEYHKSMPWLAVPFELPQRQQIQSAFQVNGIPNLKVFAPSGKLVDDNAVQSGKLSVPQIASWEKM